MLLRQLEKKNEASGQWNQREGVEVAKYKGSAKGMKIPPLCWKMQAGQCQGVSRGLLCSLETKQSPALVYFKCQLCRTQDFGCLHSEHFFLHIILSGK